MEGYQREFTDVNGMPGASAHRSLEIFSTRKTAILGSRHAEIMKLN